MTEDRALRSSRRDEIVDLAADILRQGGPPALTSVAVAERAGITQSAVYRHIASVDELAAVASRVVLTDLHHAMAAALMAPDIDWDTVTDVAAVASRMVTVMDEHRTAFEVVDRWQFVDGPLGDAVRSVVDDGCAIIERHLEHRWRQEFGWDGALDDDAVAARSGHARLFHADGHAAARVVRSSPDPRSRSALVGVLASRLVGGWIAYVADMQQRTGRDLPRYVPRRTVG